MSYTCLPQAGLLPSSQYPKRSMFYPILPMTSRSLRPASAFRGRSVRDMDNLHRPLEITSRAGEERDKYGRDALQGCKKTFGFKGNLDM